jgi:hypothetical protein
LKRLYRALTSAILLAPAGLWLSAVYEVCDHCLWHLRPAQVTGKFFVRLAAVCFHCSCFTMAHEGRRCQVSLCDEEIDSNLISDNLSDVPNDIFSESESESGTAGGSDRESECAK